MIEPEQTVPEPIRQDLNSVTSEQATSKPQDSARMMAVLPVPRYFPAMKESGQSENNPADFDPGAVAGVMLVRSYGNDSITPADFCAQTGQGAGNPLSFTQIMNALGVNAVAVELRTNLKLLDLALILFSGRPAIVPIKQAVL